MERALIRVSLAADGKTPTRELMFDGRKIGELSYLEVLTFAMQAISTLRYETDKR